MEAQQLKLNNEEIEAETKNEKKLIVVTGFGIFVGHEKINASWEAVRLLPDFLEELGDEYIIERIEVPCEYEAADNAVASIWEREPELVIHCGVHGNAECILVEKLAYNHKFTKPDYAGKRLKRSSACLKHCDGVQNDVKFTRLNVERICAFVCNRCKTSTGQSECYVQESNKDITEEKTKDDIDTIATVSKDVGNYLCGYIYLKSLDVNDHRTLFVHVPPVTKLSSTEVCDALKNIIVECVHQLKKYY